MIRVSDTLISMTELVRCLSRVRKRAIHDGLEENRRVSCTTAEPSSLHHHVTVREASIILYYSALKIFVRLIFIAVGHRRNIFNDENFPFYGINFSDFEITYAINAKM